jgi:hypothetical protein
MAPRTRDEDDLGHEAVVSNLMDLQARLRGDPASLVLPREGRRPSDAVTVSEDDVSVTAQPDPTEPLAPEQRIEVLRRKLEYLELEIDAYEHAAEETSVPPTEPPPAADVVELQHAVEERLAES